MFLKVVFVLFSDVSDPHLTKKFHVLMNKILLRMKKSCFHIRFDKPCGYGDKLKRLQLLCVPDVWETFCFILFVDNFTGSKDTEPYKTDVSFLCQYINVQRRKLIMFSLIIK